MSPRHIRWEEERHLGEAERPQEHLKLEGGLALSPDGSQDPHSHLLLAQR